MLKNLVLVLAGIVGATAFIVSCSDDSSDADAAACDCNPAEPPLTGRITRVEARKTGSSASFFEAAACPPSSTLLGGGCYAEGESGVNLGLIAAGLPQGGDFLRYGCFWENPLAGEVTVIAWATCLIPAS